MTLAPITATTPALSCDRPLRLGAYLRLSESKTDDDYADTETQLIDCKREAAHRGGEIVKVFMENDTSAFKQRKVMLPDGTVGLRVRRDEFASLMADLHSGELDGFVGYHLDRIARQPRDLEDLIDLVALRGVKIFGVASKIDLTTDEGILMARFGVIIANQASRDTSRRVSRHTRAKAVKGLPGGGPRPFGYEADRITPHATEAQLFRDAVDRILTGTSLMTVAARWNAEGVTTTRGNRWLPSSVRAMLKNPRYVGIRATKTERGWEQVIDDDGAPVRAVWEPLISEAQWADLQALFTRQATGPRGVSREGARKYLLSGILTCGLCGSAMGAMHNGQTVNYSCPPKWRGGCGGVARSVKNVDNLVTVATLTALQAAAADANTAPEEWAGAVELERAESFKAELWAMFRAGDIPAAEFTAERNRADETIKRLEGERRAHGRTVAAHADAIDVAGRWHSKTMTLAEKRAAVRSVWAAIVVEPIPRDGGRRVTRWNPDLIRLIPIG